MLIPEAEVPVGLISEDLFHLTDRCTEVGLLRGLASREGGKIDSLSMTRADARFEQERGKEITLRTPNGEVKVSRDDLGELVSFPSEVCYIGEGRSGGTKVAPGWYAPLTLVPVVGANVLEEQIAAFEVGQTIPSSLAIQYIKYNPQKTDYKATVQYGDTSIEYSALELISLLGRVGQEAFTAVRDESGISFRSQPVRDPFWHRGPAGIRESSLVAAKWPHDTATIHFLDSALTIELPKADLAASAPVDVYMDNQFRWVCQSSDALLTNEQVLNAVGKIEQGGTVHGGLAMRYRERFPGTPLDDYILNAGMPCMIARVYQNRPLDQHGIPPFTATDFTFSVIGNPHYIR